jgi:aspartate/methionine/tyrosine aminotransferase
MNPFLVNDVIYPPIIEFKENAKGILPKNGCYFDMTQAVPLFPTFRAIRNRLTEDLQKDDTSYYTDVLGIPPLREKIVQTHPLFESFSSDQVLVTAGANHAMFTAMILFFKAGDEVGLIEPCYFNYEMGLKMLGINPRFFEVSGATGFKLNSDKIIKQVLEYQVKGLILITPNNPTGASYDSNEILKLLKWTSSKGIEVIIDETYLKFDPYHLANKEIGEFFGRGLTLVGSFSKTFSLTGYRVGYLISGRKEINEALKIQDTLVICAPHLSQLAALYGLNECQKDVDQEIARMKKLEIVLVERAKKLKNFSIMSVGAFFAYMRHPFSNLTAKEAALEIFSRIGLLTLPGTIFGNKQENFVRMAFCNLTESHLNHAMDELIQLDQKL